VRQRQEGKPGRPFCWFFYEALQPILLISRGNDIDRAQGSDDDLVLIHGAWHGA
jgi:hypothetical protein